MVEGESKITKSYSFLNGPKILSNRCFDRFNVFLSTQHKDYYIYDNVKKEVVSEGTFRGRPLDAKGAADGKTAYVAFSDIAELAMINLEHQVLRYFPATENGAGAFTVGLSNNVCH